MVLKGEFIELDGAEVYRYKWGLDEFENSADIKGVVHIVHGLGEHASRYDAFAQFLVKNGYVVFAHDHRGHGKTGEKSGLPLGFVEEGFERLISDVVCFVEMEKKMYIRNGQPFIIFGHSMGSLISHMASSQLAKRGVSISGLVLCGVINRLNTFEHSALIVLTKFLSLIHGREAYSDLIQYLALGSMNKSVSNPRTNCDWLSQDPSECDKYIEDPHCGHMISVSFFEGLFNALGSSKLREVSPKCPTFIIVGDQDPVVGTNQVGVNQVRRELIDGGGLLPKIIIYGGMRHELLNEINKIEVYEDLLCWFNGVSSSSHLHESKL